VGRGHSLGPSLHGPAEAYQRLRDPYLDLVGTLCVVRPVQNHVFYIPRRPQLEPQGYHRRFYDEAFGEGLLGTAVWVIPFT
jgi:hypothetical protein